MINKGFLAIFLSLSLFGCNMSSNDKEITTDLVNIPNGDAAPGSLPVIKFSEESHDFGTVIEGESISYTFKFKNTGGSDLIISSAQGSCGCTVPEYPKKPIKPNEEDKIVVTFNSSGKQGYNKKDVTLVTNAQPNTKVISIIVNVEPKK
jgi:Protein of unknown function (DUF1573)